MTAEPVRGEPRSYVVTGATSPPGVAVVRLLAGAGARVVTVDRERAHVRADLAAPSGRAAMLGDVGRLTGGAVDAVIACGAQPDDEHVPVEVGYFGVVATVAGLRPLLAYGPAPRAVTVSVSSREHHEDPDLVQACLAGDEALAIEIADHLCLLGRGDVVRSSATSALHRWVRRHAVTREWAGQGVLLNAVAGVSSSSDTLADLVTDLASPRNQVVTGAVLTASDGARVALRGAGAW